MEANSQDVDKLVVFAIRCRNLEFLVARWRIEG
jgi:hypothetical protein